MHNLKKKVFINGRFLTAQLSGVQRVAYELVTQLDNLIDSKPETYNGYEFILIYSGEAIVPIKLLHIRQVSDGFFTGNLWEQIELPFRCRGHLLVSLCSISTLFKTKQILMVHDASFFVNPEFFSIAFRTWYKIAIPLIGRICKQIITVSQFSKKDLVTYGGLSERKITVIYNAADHVLRVGEPTMEFKAKIDLLAPFCLAVSSLGTNKNFEGLNIAFSKLDFSGYHMLVAGGMSNVLKQTKGDSAISYLGYVSDAELRYLYKKATLFIFPSFYEGFGIPPLEAMISGCPVLASHTSAMPEVLGSACIYLNPYNPADMTAKIQDLLNDPSKRGQLHKAGLSQAGKYSWKGSAKQLMMIISQYI